MRPLHPCKTRCLRGCRTSMHVATLAPVSANVPFEPLSSPLSDRRPCGCFKHSTQEAGPQFLRIRPRVGLHGVVAAPASGCLPINCDDADAGTVTTCSSGVCSHDPIDCDDGDACTIDSCSEGVTRSNAMTVIRVPLMAVLMARARTIPSVVTTASTKPPPKLMAAIR